MTDGRDEIVNAANEPSESRESPAEITPFSEQAPTSNNIGKRGRDWDIEELIAGASDADSSKYVNTIAEPIPFEIELKQIVSVAARNCPVRIDRVTTEQLTSTRNYAIGLAVLAGTLAFILIAAASVASLYQFIAFSAKGSLTSAIASLLVGLILAIFAERFVRLAHAATDLKEEPSKDRFQEFISSQLSVYRLAFAVLFSGFGFLLLLISIVGVVLFVKLYLG